MKTRKVFQVSGLWSKGWEPQGFYAVMGILEKLFIHLGFGYWEKYLKYWYIWIRMNKTHSIMLSSNGNTSMYYRSAQWEKDGSSVRSICMWKILIFIFLRNNFFIYFYSTIPYAGSNKITVTQHKKAKAIFLIHKSQEHSACNKYIMSLSQNRIISHSKIGILSILQEIIQFCLDQPQ